ncbi:Arf17p [Asimina triloba]
MVANYSCFISVWTKSSRCWIRTQTRLCRQSETPRRHLLTIGWSKLVNQKKLVAGDSVVSVKNRGKENLSGGAASCVWGLWPVDDSGRRLRNMGSSQEWEGEGVTGGGGEGLRAGRL